MTSSIFSSNVIVLATAMVAVSGTVILLAFRLQKPPPTTTAAGATKVSTINHHPRPCISIDGKKRAKKKKKVHFAEDVMEPRGSGEEFRKRLRSKNVQKWRTSSSLCKDEGGKRKINLPANRIALYTGILRDRNVQRFAYS
ncbi:hypothetical protein L1987_01425 [Smallanthus sonchifolius]|uniref:Uncharacterized protein n=1 Tax=Smallanthus sonchifolius TaxID=185202 RepID=A0ACB9K528_9ASTR|nr:hypothetical protein L1987_01425 [Smallanthus sonchifolius]